MSEFAKVLRQSLSNRSPSAGDAAITADSTLRDAEATAKSIGVDLPDLLADAALVAHRQRTGSAPRAARQALDFIVANRRSEDALRYARVAGRVWALKPSTVLGAVRETNRAIELISDLSAANGAPIFELLGLRNLSSFVGEIFAAEVRKLHPSEFLKNPNQDGYPDLLALTPTGRAYIDEKVRDGQISDKRHWSPYPYGGIEIKATCGNTPPAKVTRKPEIGDSRIGILVSAEWKAHHRETNNLLALYWDFVDRLPTVLAVFYRNDLTEDDWGKVIQPKENGGRTTSVSIMTRPAVEKMGAGWLVLPASRPILKSLAQGRVFALDRSALVSACSDSRATTLLA